MIMDAGERSWEIRVGNLCGCEGKEGEDICGWEGKDVRGRKGECLAWVQFVDC